MEACDFSSGESVANRRLHVIVQDANTKLIERQFYCIRSNLAHYLDLAPSKIHLLMSSDRLEIDGKVILISYP